MPNPTNLYPSTPPQHHPLLNQRRLFVGALAHSSLTPEESRMSLLSLCVPAKKDAKACWEGSNRWPKRAPAVNMFGVG